MLWISRCLLFKGLAYSKSSAAEEEGWLESLLELLSEGLCVRLPNMSDEIYHEIGRW